ncbi:MAG: disulfide bond formation protein B [Acetobacteraceae bacterium]|nr:disulfide bond formation protein B [Acetobacteraceae bacterium]
MTRPIGLATASLLAAGAALAVADLSERWGGLVPCALCLLERWPYRLAILLSALALLLSARGGRLLLWLVVLAIGAAAVLGAVHVGVEQGAWPSPLPECAAPALPAGGSLAERLSRLPATPAKPCDDPTYLVPGLPVSMAGGNLLYALAFALILAISLWRTRRTTA